MFHQMVDWVSGSNWSYLVILGVAILDAFFPFVPSESIVIVAGTLAGAGDLNVFLVILSAWAGAVIGDNISYGIGKFAGERTVKRLFQPPEGAEGVRLGRKAARGTRELHHHHRAVHPVRAHRGHVHGRLHEGPAVAPLLPLRPRRRRALGDLRHDARLHRRQAVRGAAVEGRGARARRSPSPSRSSSSGSGTAAQSERLPRLRLRPSRRL